VDLVYLAEERDNWRAVVNLVINIKTLYYPTDAQIYNS